MIKLLIITKNIDGGAGTFINQLSHLSEVSDIQISLVSLTKQRMMKVPSFSGLAFFSESHKKRTDSKMGIDQLFLIFKEALFIKEHMQRIKPDIVLSVDTHSNILVCLIKKIFFNKTKLIITNHNNVEKIFDEKLTRSAGVIIRFLGKVFFSSADLFVCPSKGIGKSFSDYFMLKQKVNVIPYGINIKKTQYLSREAITATDEGLFSVYKKKKTIISIGRLEKQKDYETLIKAVKLVHDNLDSVKLIIVGEGSARNELEKLTYELGLRKVVYFLGWKDNIYPYLRNSSLFVLSSNYEGFGWVLLEAMTQGLPIISTDSPYGPREVLDNGRSGILVPVGNISKMKIAILKTLQVKDEYKKYSQRSRDRIQFFSEKKMLFEYKKLINGAF